MSLYLILQKRSTQWTILFSSRSCHATAFPTIRLNGFSFIDRSQRCYINDKSSLKYITCGIPQGSILGPLLFIIYINDLPASVQYSNTRMYAEDTNLTTQGTSLNSLYNKVNRDIVNISNWLRANKLSLNSAKTELMCIAFDDKLRKVSTKPPIYLENRQVTRVSSTKTLGVIIDERMSWTSHSDYICKKISSGLGVLRLIRFQFP